jgi:hypothetical protein
LSDDALQAKPGPHRSNLLRYQVRNTVAAAVVSHITIRITSITAGK